MTNGIAELLVEVAPQRRDLQGAALAITLQLAAVAWFVLFLVVATTTEERSAEVALAKLRGLSLRRTAVLALAEPIVLLLVAAPPVQVSAAPVAAAAAVVAKEPPKPPDPRRKVYASALAAVLFALLAAYSPAAFLGHFTVFALAVFVGFYVISNVAHALHTPLMSETNAISGIILVGGLLQVGNDNLAVTVLAVIAVLVASINIFGGFLVTSRMLQMFRKD